MRRMTFYCSCVGPLFSKKEMGQIQRNARNISRSTFRKRIDEEHLKSLEKELGYEINRRSGMVMADDFYVNYFKSFYSDNGAKEEVYFLSHSSIEYFFK